MFTIDNNIMALKHDKVTTPSRTNILIVCVSLFFYLLCWYMQCVYTLKHATINFMIEILTTARIISPNNYSIKQMK